MTRIMTPRRFVATAWIILFCGSVIGIGIETEWGRRWVWPVKLTMPEPASFAKPSLADPFALPSADAFLEIAMRPLFVASRRPTPTVATAENAPKPSMKRDQFVLTGTTIVPEGKFAHLLEKAGNKSHVIAEGNDINGINVKEIKPGQVILSQNDETEILPLRIVKVTSQPPAQPAAAATSDAQNSGVSTPVPPSKNSQRFSKSARLPFPSSATSPAQSQNAQ